MHLPFRINRFKPEDHIRPFFLVHKCFISTRRKYFTQPRIFSNVARVDIDMIFAFIVHVIRPEKRRKK